MIEALQNKTIYPTPRNLIDKMLAKITDKPDFVLDPSAGMGDLLIAAEQKFRDQFRYLGTTDFSAIEIDDNLRAMLIGKSIKTIGSDFLEFGGPDKFDLILMNPPFCDGDKHLLKAIDMVYNGQIVCLLNAETIKNPYSLTRKELVERLNKLNAEIEFIQGGFIGPDAHRKTDVDIAMINIKISNNIENDLFSDASDPIPPVDIKIDEYKEVSTGKKITELVAEYNQVIDLAVETILSYVKNRNKIEKYISIEIGKKSTKYSSHYTEKLFKVAQQSINAVIDEIRKDYWTKTLYLQEVISRMTSKQKDEFYASVKTNQSMEFTENNIRSFVLNIINAYPSVVQDAISKLFDKFTIAHTYHGTVDETNVHYFNGWKTNKAFKVNKKIIIPFYSGYGDTAFYDNILHQWKLYYNIENDLNDIDIVMNYFDGKAPNYSTIANRLKEAFSHWVNSTSSTYFSKITAHRKGTLHLTFADDDILRRFNIEAAKGKNWLPRDYGVKPYAQLDYETQQVVDSFEGKKSYMQNLGIATISNQPQLQLFDKAA